MQLTKIKLDGIEIPAAGDDQTTSPDEDVVAQVFEMMAEIEEAERPRFILSTSTSRG